MFSDITARQIESVLKQYFETKVPFRPNQLCSLKDLNTSQFSALHKTRFKRSFHFTHVIVRTVVSVTHVFSESTSIVFLCAC